MSSKKSGYTGFYRMQRDMASARGNVDLAERMDKEFNNGKSPTDGKAPVPNKPPVVKGSGVFDTIKNKVKDAWNYVKENPIKTLGAVASIATLGHKISSDVKREAHNQSVGRKVAELQARNREFMNRPLQMEEQARIGSETLEQKIDKQEPPKYWRLTNSLMKNKKFTKEKGFDVGGGLSKKQIKQVEACCLLTKENGTASQKATLRKHLKGGSLQGIINFLSNTFPKWVARWTGADRSLARDITRGIKRRGKGLGGYGVKGKSGKPKNKPHWTQEVKQFAKDHNLSWMSALNQWKKLSPNERKMVHFE